MSSVELMKLIKGNVLSLKPYHVESFDCEIKLHANENPFAPSKELLELFSTSFQKLQLNRYPDPDSKVLKDSIADRLGIETNHLVIGNGSDEIILFLLQVFCREGDSIAFPDPTFAMYSIIAQSLGIKSVHISLDSRWDFSADVILQSAEENNSKIIFLSYPNNPTGNCFSDTQVQKVIEGFQGIVVIDEAYHDFSRKSFIHQVEEHNNLVVLRSLSKIGLAALRVGFGVADPLVINEINKVRLPYNSNTVSQAFAEHIMTNFEVIQTQIDSILGERNRLLSELQRIESVTAFPSDSNFILFKTKQPAGSIFSFLAKNGILVRNLSSHPKLNNCLRVTVGTKSENDRFLSKLKEFIS